MNKKVRILALALAVAVALVGAGYAAWGTGIESTTKMHSGEWKIVLENDSDASYWAGDQIGTFKRENALSGDYGETDWSDLDQTYDAPPVGEDGVVSGANYVYVMEPVPNIPSGVDPSAEANETSCTFQFFNLHPGTRAFTRFEIRNDGTIGAQIGDVRVKLLDVYGNELDEHDVAEKQVVAEMMVNPVFAIHHGNGNSDTSLIDGTTCTLEDLEGVLKNALIGKELNCNNMLYSYDVNADGSDELETGPDLLLENSFNFELPAEALEGNIGMQANFQVVIEFDFVQYNQFVDEPVA